MTLLCSHFSACCGAGTWQMTLSSMWWAYCCSWYLWSTSVQWWACGGCSCSAPGAQLATSPIATNIWPGYKSHSPSLTLCTTSLGLDLALTLWEWLLGGYCITLSARYKCHWWVDITFLTLIVPKAWEIVYTQSCINCRGKSATHFVYFWSRKTLPYTLLEATSYISQLGQSLAIWTTSLSTTGCYKDNYTIQFVWMACISRFATAIISGETELALGTVRVKGGKWWNFGHFGQKSLFHFIT